MSVSHRSKVTALMVMHKRSYQKKNTVSKTHIFARYEHFHRKRHSMGIKHANPIYQNFSRMSVLLKTEKRHKRTDKAYMVDASTRVPGATTFRIIPRENERCPGRFSGGQRVGEFKGPDGNYICFFTARLEAHRKVTEHWSRVTVSCTRSFSGNRGEVITTTLTRSMSRQPRSRENSRRW